MIPQESELEKSGGRTRVSAEQHLMLGTQTWLEYSLSIQSNKKAEGNWNSPKPGSLSPQRPALLRSQWRLFQDLSTIHNLMQNL